MGGDDGANVGAAEAAVGPHVSSGVQLHDVRFAPAWYSDSLHPHNANAESLMLNTELGITNETRLEHPLKALTPMLVTELGRISDDRLVQPRKV